MLGGGGLADPVDHQTRLVEGPGVRLQRTMRTDEGHLETIADDLVFVERFLEIRAADHERALGGIALELTRRIERVDDRDAEAAARLKDAGAFADGAVEVVYILERHERDNAIEDASENGSAAASARCVS